MEQKAQINEKNNNEEKNNSSFQKDDFLNVEKTFNKFYRIIFLICGIVSFIGLILVITGFYLSNDSAKLGLSVTGIIFFAGGFITYYVLSLVKKTKYNNLIIKYEVEESMVEKSKKDKEKII